MKPSGFGQRGDEKFPATLPVVRFLIFRTMKDELQNELRELLSRLPDAPVASNFTARVLQQIDLEESRRARKWDFIFNWRSFLPRAAAATVAILFAGLALQHHEASERRAQVVQSVALVAETPMPDVDALKNFDAIQRMSQPAHADEELLALMK
jgi:anti-sigma-K factor RskA